MTDAASAGAAAPAPDRVADGVGAESGRPLPPDVRAEFETRFRHSFADVRVYSGATAARDARRRGARAVTVGRDIAFAEGAYDPLSARGRALLAHELAHVAQTSAESGAAAGGGLPALRAAAGTPIAAGEGERETHSTAASTASLEQQARTAAGHAASGHALPAGWTWRPAAPGLALHAQGDPVGDTGPPPSTDPTTGGGLEIEYPRGKKARILAEEVDPAAPDAVTLRLQTFIVPVSKGPWAERYAQVAKAGALQSIIVLSGGTIRSGLWEKRAPTPELRRLWLSLVEWPSDRANEWWHEAGGNKETGADFAPKVNGEASQIDHIVELQLGGTNVPENLAPHDARDNEASGREIWLDLSGAVRSWLERRPPGALRPRVVRLAFAEATPAGDYATKAAGDLPAAAGPERDAALAARRQQRAPNAASVHLTARNDHDKGRRPTQADREARNAALVALPEYPLQAGASAHTFRLPAAPPKSDPVETNEFAENRVGRELIPGMSIESIERQRSPHRVRAWLGSKDHKPREGTRIPFDFDGKTPVLLDVVDKDGMRVLKAPKASPQFAFTYPYLSKGWMKLTSDDTGRIGGTGEITPSIPLLRRTIVGVEWDSTTVKATLKAPPERLSLPPFRVTKAELALQIAPAFDLSGALEFELGKRITGSLTSGVDAAGFFARGTVVALIPGVDEARGTVEYRPSTGLRGFALATVSRPGGVVRTGTVRADFKDGDWVLSGEVRAVLPDGTPATLTVRRAGERTVYSGEAEIKVPGLEPVTVSVRYDGERVSGSAKTRFTLLGAKGQLDLRYLEGRFSGTGTVDLRRGSFAGRLDAQLHPDGVLTGKGSGTYEFKPGLVGTIAIEYGRDRRLKTTGEMKFPTYRFLDQRANRRELFRRDLPDIPIFAIPAGPKSIGLIAKIGGSLAASYGYGPGEIRNMVIRATLYPLEEDIKPSLEASAMIVLPAYAGLELSVRAGIGLSIGIADATGGITVTGGIRLQGGAEAGLKLAYRNSVLVFDAKAKIAVKPILTLAIDADFTIDVVAMDPIRYPYQLASYKYDPGLEFGLVAPFHYQSDQPLRMPEAEDIQWIIPDIDVARLVKSLGSSISSAMG